MNITENGRIFIPELENQLLFFIENDGAYNTHSVRIAVELYVWLPSYVVFKHTFDEVRVIFSLMLSWEGWRS